MLSEFVLHNDKPVFINPAMVAAVFEDGKYPGHLRVFLQGCEEDDYLSIKCNLYGFVRAINESLSPKTPSVG